MYKKQMAIQRILCILAIIACAAVFVYSLGFMTDVYDMIYAFKTKYKANQEEIQQFLDNMQLFNRDLVKAGIGLILVSLTLLLTNTHSRRKYYLGNYAATLLNAGVFCAASVWAHAHISELKNQYYSGNIDFALVKETVDKNARKGGISAYTDSAFWFDAHYYLFGILLLIAVLLILNAIWKTILMRQEKAALTTGKAVL